ncbi:TonB-dependent siderophore receptor [Massilia sp. S19_KUP03_FR1]|uniref:TonB-dependent siderophore receptor n=1 Tax=Massilia sp. S19_KUP03_FR1 TaxID=3025503 RepID=UPI002FCD7DCC
MKHTLQYTALACALAQAFSAHAQSADTPIAQVLVSASKTSPERASVAGFGDAALFDTPASVVAFSRARMQDLSIRSSSDAMAFDSSVSDAYNAVGYAEQFSIRGFKLDNNSSYRKDGLIIPADTQIPLENKERIEILKGLSGLQAGISSPGGVVNYVTKRPTATPLLSASAGVSERGTLYGAVDAGGRFTDTRFGYRINAAGEKLRSYVRGADGERSFVSGAFDWQISPDALLQLDLDYQHKSQLTAPGYQLLANAVLPPNVSAKTFLGEQPWARPVDTVSSNLGLRFEYKLAPEWNASVALNKHWFRRDDFTAFPYGCSNEGDGYYPGFCANGDYDVYDYQSTGERKTPLGAQAQIQGKFNTGALRHQATFGLSYSTRRDSAGKYVYDYAGYSNIYQNLIVAPAPGQPVTGPVTLRHLDRERGAYVQDIVALSNRVVLHTGVRYESVRSDRSDHFLLPNVALVWRALDTVNLYASVAHGMEYGGAGGIDTLNYAMPLAPKRSKQVEIGAKASVNTTLELAAALFEIKRGHEYTDLNRNLFVREGEERNRGIELSAQGKATPQLSYMLSATALNTLVTGTTDASINGKRVADVPALKTSAFVEYALSALPGLKVNGQWQYAGKKAFQEDNRTFVPGYHVFNLGAQYGLKLAGVATTVRARVENVADRFYWRDVSPDLGGYLLPGAPRTFALSAQFDF